MAKSNLGHYQYMVELAKKANGPVKLGIYVLAGGILVGGIASAAAGDAIKKGVGMAVDAAREKIRPSATPKPKVYTVHTGADGGSKLWLHAGDTFTASNEVGGGVLIVVSRNRKNPWMVSSELLVNISDFQAGDTER